MFSAECSPAGDASKHHHLSNAESLIDEKQDVLLLNISTSQLFDHVLKNRELPAQEYLHPYCYI